MIIAEPSWPDWISAIASLVSAIAVVVGAYLGLQQISVWRTQSLQQKRASLAEDILSLAHEIDDVMRLVRSPFESIPLEKKDDKYYILDARFSRLSERNEVFDKMRKTQVRAKFILRDTEVEKAIDKLFQARRNFNVALEMLALYARDPPQSDESKDIYLQSRRTLYGTFSDDDELHTSIQVALATLELRLGPTVRLNDGR